MELQSADVPEPGGIMPRRVMTFVRGLACRTWYACAFSRGRRRACRGSHGRRGSGAPALLLSSFDLAPLGYATNEFFILGTASSYKLAGAPTPDWRWDATPAATAPYATRIVVVRPTDPKKFNGPSSSSGLTSVAAPTGRPTGTRYTATAGAARSECMGREGRRASCQHQLPGG